MLYVVRRCDHDLADSAVSCYREPVEIKKRGKDFCGNSQSCFELKVPTNTTMLETYNCERQRGPKKEVMPAEKQVRWI